MRERWGFWLKRLPTADSESLPTVLVAAMPRYDRACCRSLEDRSRYHGDSLDKSVARRPSRGTGRGRKNSVTCTHPGSGSRTSETRRWADNPSAAKKRFVQYSHLIVSQSRIGPDAAKNVIDIFKSKKAEMPGKPLCNNQLHGHRDSTTGQ